jgi:hypothetical protein
MRRPPSGRLRKHLFSLLRRRSRGPDVVRSFSDVLTRSVLKLRSLRQGSKPKAETADRGLGSREPGPRALTHAGARRWRRQRWILSCNCRSRTTQPIQAGLTYAGRQPSRSSGPFASWRLGFPGRDSSSAVTSRVRGEQENAGPSAEDRKLEPVFQTLRLLTATFAGDPGRLDDLIVLSENAADRGGMGLDQAGPPPRAR